MKTSFSILLFLLREVRLTRNVLCNPRGLIIRWKYHLRSMMGTYTLLDENFRNTAATISLYIRISYLGKCLITEITKVKSIREAFYIRGDSSEKQPYFSRQLISKELQSGCWVDSSFPHVPRGLICRCEELVKKETADLASNWFNRFKQNAITKSSMFRKTQENILINLKNKTLF